MFKDLILKQLPDFYRDDVFINDLFGAVGLALDGIFADMNEVDQQRFFDKLTVLLRDSEKLLGILPMWGWDNIIWGDFFWDDETTDENELDSRRAAVEAKWQSSAKCDLYLLQSVANAWHNGEVDVSFSGGKIRLTFNGSYGVPANLESLIKAINEVKPAHLGFEYDFKWLLIKDVHNVLTIDEMQQLTISQFARGSY